MKIPLVNNCVIPVSKFHLKKHDVVLEMVSDDCTPMEALKIIRSHDCRSCEYNFDGICGCIYDKETIIDSNFIENHKNCDNYGIGPNYYCFMRKNGEKYPEYL